MNKHYNTLAGLAVIGLTAMSGVANADPFRMITFDEFAVGTEISNQYANLGVVFSRGKNGNYPVIADDGAMPNSPVLSPNPPYAGDFDIEFLTSTTWVQFQSGFWDALGTAVIDVFDWAGNLTTYSNDATGVVNFEFHDPKNGVRRIVFNSANDPAGADIDNLKFNVPEPGILFLLGAGLLGAFRLGGKRQ